MNNLCHGALETAADAFDALLAGAASSTAFSLVYLETSSAKRCISSCLALGPSHLPNGGTPLGAAQQLLQSLCDPPSPLTRAACGKNIPACCFFMSLGHARLLLQTDNADLVEVQDILDLPAVLAGDNSWAPSDQLELCHRCCGAEAKGTARP